MLRNPWNSYRKVATQTATPGQLVLMLFEGAARSLDRALDGFDMEDPAERFSTINNNIQRAQEILHELNMALDMEQGGKLADTLRGLYEYMDRRLLESNVRKTDDGIHEVRARMGVLRDAWAEMLKSGGAEPPMEGAPETGLSMAAA